MYYFASADFGRIALTEETITVGRANFPPERGERYPQYISRRELTATQVPGGVEVIAKGKNPLRVKRDRNVTTHRKDTPNATLLLRRGDTLLFEKQKKGRHDIELVVCVESQTQSMELVLSETDATQVDDERGEQGQGGPGETEAEESEVAEVAEAEAEAEVAEVAEAEAEAAPVAEPPAQAETGPAEPVAEPVEEHGESSKLRVVLQTLAKSSVDTTLLTKAETRAKRRVPRLGRLGGVSAVGRAVEKKVKVEPVSLQAGVWHIKRQ